MYYEEFEVGKCFKSRSRTITQTDVESFTSLSWAVNPIFLSDEKARERGLQARVTPGVLTLAYTIGLLYQTGIFDHIVALSSLNNVVFKSPVFIGDEIEAEALVSEMRETKNPQRGIVKLSVSCINKTRQTTCMECEMVFVMLRRSQ